MRKRLGCLVLVVASLGSGCPFGQYCRPTETRCLGNTVEICDSTEHWAKLMPCGEVGWKYADPWVCCEISYEDQGQIVKDHACMPPSECKQGGAR